MIRTQVILKKGKEKPVNNHHPWLYSGAISRIEGNPANGDVVDVWNSKARFLARGIYNEKSQIRVRLFTWNPNDYIDENFWRRRIRRAIAGRQAIINDHGTDAYRLIYAEADGTPGLIVDQYGTWLIVQFLSLAAQRYRSTIVDTLVDFVSPQGIYNRSDIAEIAQEGLIPISGPLWGEIPPDLIEIIENGHTFLVDIKMGQNTGFYLDQRENRQKIMKYLANKEIFNAFSYTSAFAVYAAYAQAKRIINVDNSENTLQLAQRNMARNGFGNREEDIYSAADANSLLQAYSSNKWKFDVVILDPPVLIHGKRDTTKNIHKYRELNIYGTKLVKKGGVLITFCRSEAVNNQLFQKTMFEAAIASKRNVQIIEHLHQSSDHPISLTFPQSNYLKGFVCRVW